MRVAAAPSWVRMTAVLIAAPLIVAGCTKDAPVASPTPTVPVLPSPVPVAGERPPPTVISLANGPVVFNPGDPDGAVAEPDAAAIDGFVDRVGDLLDAHLDDVQRGGGGTLAERADPGIRAAIRGRLEDDLTRVLATPEYPVESARYTLEVFHDGPPQWLVADVSVTGTDGETAAVTLVFVPGDGGEPVLIAVEPAPDPREQPSPSPSTSPRRGRRSPTPSPSPTP